MNLGQIFTKEKVAELMVSMISKDKKTKVLDPCFGQGVFLETLTKQGFSNISGMEIDEKLYKKYSAEKQDITLINGDFLSYSFKNTFEVIIMNPPYVRHEELLNDYPFSKKDLRKNHLFNELPANANLYMYFVIKALDILAPSGELIVIFPDTWKKTIDGKSFFNLISKNNSITESIDVSGIIFENSPMVKVAILKIVKEPNLPTSIQKRISFGESGFDEETGFYGEKFNEIFKSPVIITKYISILRGVTTGANSIFINPHIDNIKYSECLMPIISSPKNIHGYSTSMAEFDTLLKYDERYHDKYIEKYLKGKKEKILSSKKPKTLYKLILENRSWYKQPERKPGKIIFSYFVRTIPKFIWNERMAQVRDNFYILYPNDDDYLVFALLNNYYTYYQLEILGKNYGNGLLKLQKYDIERLLVPNIGEMRPSDIVNLKVLAQELSRTGDSKLIDKISQIISNYSNPSYFQIKSEYERIKLLRLGGI